MFDLSSFFPFSNFAVLLLNLLPFNPGSATAATLSFVSKSPRLCFDAGNVASREPCPQLDNFFGWNVAHVTLSTVLQMLKDDVATTHRRDAPLRVVTQGNRTVLGVLGSLIQLSQQARQR